MTQYVFVNIYRLKASPATIYAFANKTAEQAKARQDGKNRTARQRIAVVCPCWICEQWPFRMTK